MPRREERERKARQRAVMQAALDCQAWGALTPAARFRYFGDRLIYEACETQNSQSRVRTVARELLAPRTICLNFVPGAGYTVQAMHLDHRTTLGPMVKVQSAETLHRLAAYLGASPPSSRSLLTASGDGAKVPCRSRSYKGAKTYSASAAFEK
jgi:hypothetical protein